MVATGGHRLMGGHMSSVLDRRLSIVEGGPLDRLQLCLGLMKLQRPLIVRRAVIFAADPNHNVPHSPLPRPRLRTSKGGALKRSTSYPQTSLTGLVHLTEIVHPPPR